MLTYWDLLPRRINKDEVQPKGLKSNKQENNTWQNSTIYLCKLLLSNSKIYINDGRFALHGVWVPPVGRQKG